LRYDSTGAPIKIEDPIPVYTNLPNNRVIDLEKPHRFFYEDITVLTHPGSPRPPVVFIGSTINRAWNDPTGDFYIDIDAFPPFHYRIVFAGSWMIPTPIYNAEGNDPYNIMPYLRRFIYGARRSLTGNLSSA
jgi:hypothetical protein